MTPKALSREIKFRCWDIENNRWIYKDGYTFDELCANGYEIGEKLNVLVWLQFTGIQDKHGNNICEGDILFGDIMPHKHSVEYIGSGFKVFGRDLNWKPDHNSKPLNEIFEIIGNIYENPELLN